MRDEYNRRQGGDDYPRIVDDARVAWYFCSMDTQELAGEDLDRITRARIRVIEFAFPRVLEPDEIEEQALKAA